MSLMTTNDGRKMHPSNPQPKNGTHVMMIFLDATNMCLCVCACLLYVLCTAPLQYCTIFYCIKYEAPLEMLMLKMFPVKPFFQKANICFCLFNVLHSMEICYKLKHTHACQAINQCYTINAIKCILCMLICKTIDHPNQSYSHSSSYRVIVSNIQRWHYFCCCLNRIFIQWQFSFFVLLFLFFLF